MPADNRSDRIGIDHPSVARDPLDHSGEHALIQQVRGEAEVADGLVPGIVVMFFGLDARVLDMGDLDCVAGGARRVGDGMSELPDRELLGELIEDAELARFRRIEDHQLDAAQVLRWVSIAFSRHAIENGAEGCSAK